MLLAAFSPPLPAQGLAGVSIKVQPKMVKIYGAGGIQGLESYQSGFLVSGDGHIGRDRVRIALPGSGC